MTLRIGHVIASIADLAAGTSHSVPQLCNALASKGHEVELHALDDGGATLRADQLYALHTYRRTFSERRVGFSPAMLEGLRRAAGRLDIMHWHGLWMMPNVYPHWATQGTGCRTVVSPRGMLQAAALARSPMLKRLTWALLQGRAVKAANVIHATSLGEAEAIRELGLVNPIAIVSNGIAVPAAIQPAPRAGQRRLLFLGRVHPIKAIDRVIRAWRLVQDSYSEWQFDVVGPDCDGHLKALQNLVSTIGAQRVSFHPRVVGHERDRWLASAELHVLASHSENFAMTVAESLAVGVPVICSRNTPWASVQEQRCGFWVENSVESLRDCLEAALAVSPGELAAMGARGRAWMERSFTWEAKAEQLSAVYDWQLGSPAPECLQTSGDSRRASPHHIPRIA